MSILLRVPGTLAASGLLLATGTSVGGVYLTNVTIDGRAVQSSTSVTLSAGTTSSLCFALEGYSYSGRRNESAYLPFVLRSSAKPAVGQPIYFALKLAPRLEGDDPNEFKLTHCVPLDVPARGGRFVVEADRVLMFPSDFKSFDSLAVGASVKQTFARYPSLKQTLGNIVASTNVVAATNDFETYLRLNGKVPASEERVTPGIGRAPVVFSWFIKPATADVEHRYRLFPTQKDWSDWDTTSRATFYFIPQGAHQLQVVSRVKRGADWVVGRQAEYQFFLSDPLIAKPISKGAGESAATPPPNPASLYVKSRALVVAVDGYDDPSFGVLPFSGTDVDSLSATLRRQGFEVTALHGRRTRAQLAGAIDGFVRAAAQRERLVIYLSTHGFSDKLDPNKGYIVSSDCHPAQPSTCLSLQEIDGLLHPALATTTGKPIQHLLLLLDACSAGLGVIDKAGGFVESSIAAQQGSHIMTAGLASQKAEQDPSLRPPMSTFTYFVTKGLNGAADYTSDGVISLSELLVYVRYNVALQTQSRQTPMMGRLYGTGEMVFTVPARAP